MTESNQQESVQSTDQPGKPRGSNWTEEEDLQLCESWLFTPLDPIIPKDQEVVPYWERIRRHFTLKIPTKSNKNRSAGSLKSRWTVIKSTVFTFDSHKRYVGAVDKSGADENELMNRAREMFKKVNKNGKEFNMMSCYDVVKDHPKWRRFFMVRRTPNPTNIPSTSSPVIAPPIPVFSLCRRTPNPNRSLPHNPVRNPFPAKIGLESNYAVKSSSFRPAGMEKSEKIACRKRKREKLLDNVEEKLLGLMDDMKNYMNENVLSVDPDKIKDPRRKAYYLARQKQILDQWEADEKRAKEEVVEEETSNEEETSDEEENNSEDFDNAYD